MSDDELPGGGTRLEHVAGITVEGVRAGEGAPAVPPEIRRDGAVACVGERLGDPPPHRPGGAEPVEEEDAGERVAERVQVEAGHGLSVPGTDMGAYAGLVRAVRRLLGISGLAWLVLRLFAPDREPRYDGEQRRPIHIPGRSVFVGERELFVREAGPEGGTPLVLAHGWGFDGEMNFHAVIPPLSERLRLVIPDHRNHGKSDRIRGAFDIDDLADELVGVLDALDYDRVDLFGYSLGGLAAQVVAHRSPERVRRLILAGTAACPVTRLRPGVAAAARLGRCLARLSPREMSMLTFRSLRSSAAIDPSYEQWLWAGLRNRDPTLSYESAFAALRFDSRRWVGEIEAPTMVIIPTADRIVPPAAQRDLAARIRPDRIVELRGAGHASILAQPGGYVDAIASFLLDETGVHDAAPVDASASRLVP